MKIIKIIVGIIIVILALSYVSSKVLGIDLLSLNLSCLFDKINKTNFDSDTNPGGIHMTAKKPAIYLYPTSTQKIKVSLDINGTIIKSIPDYNNGWEVVATKEGLINNKFDYLFYENTLNTIDLPSESWVVKTSDLSQWFSKNLPLFGLNQKEITQFKEYWLENLNKENFYQIKLLSSDYLNENMKLNIEPKPNTVIRLMFYFEPLKNKVTTIEPKITTPQRSGFAVVEWGGVLKN